MVQGNKMGCRFCNSPLDNIFIELGNAPPTNSFRTEEQLNEPEIAYPLRVFVCDKCFLVQVDEHRAHNEIFGDDYVYFSSVSQPWLEHCKKYADFIIPHLNLNNKSQVIEIASNDGYLLQYFKEKGLDYPMVMDKIIRNGEYGINMIERIKKYTNDLISSDKVVLYSDAFFPFRDGLDAAAELGVKYIVQPGGSKNDEEVIKSAITKASLFDPIANRTYSDLASHYGFQINPCKPSTPEHKGKVESGVKYAKNNFLPLRTFTDVQDADTQIQEWNKTKAQVRIHGTTRQKPIEVFSAYEKDKLLPMDKEVFETPLYKELTVHTDSHIQFEQAYYSVPYELREQRVLARKTEAQLCVFYENKLVALHQSAKKGQRRTNKDHYPPNMFRYMQYDEEYCMEKAGEIGSGVLKLISSLLKENTVKNLRGAQNILRLEEKYTRQKLEKAVTRALYYGNYTYQGVKEILEKGLENETDFEEGTPKKELSKGYARDLKEIIKEAVN